MSDLELLVSDLELLELAAKAAGLEIEPEYEVNGWLPLGRDEAGDIEAWWNPLADDGDALRLAVKLQIVVGRYDSYVSAGVIGSDIDEVIAWLYEYRDPYVATRRAIVRVAAEIGKQQP